MSAGGSAQGGARLAAAQRNRTRFGEVCVFISDLAIPTERREEHGRRVSNVGRRVRQRRSLSGYKLLCWPESGCGVTYSASALWLVFLPCGGSGTGCKRGNGQR